MNQLRELTNSLNHTIRKQTLRLSIILFIAFASYYKYYQNPKENEHWFHTFLEFIGVAFIFLIVEHALKKTDSGISDPEPLPLNDFIKNIKKASNSLIIFDTFIESILIDEKRRLLFEKNLKYTLKNSERFKVKILLLKPDSEFSSTRAKERGLNPDIYNKNMKDAKKYLIRIKDDICEENRSQLNRFEIREYEASPPFAMYAIDKRAYISFYPEGEKSTDVRQLYLGENTPLCNLIFKFYYDVFSNMWKSANKVE